MLMGSNKQNTMIFWAQLVMMMGGGDNNNGRGGWRQLVAAAEDSSSWSMTATEGNWSVFVDRWDGDSSSL
jgi:hypothetical protein